MWLNSILPAESVIKRFACLLLSDDPNYEVQQEALKGLPPVMQMKSNSQEENFSQTGVGVAQSSDVSSSHDVIRSGAGDIIGTMDGVITLLEMEEYGTKEESENLHFPIASSQSCVDSTESKETNSQSAIHATFPSFAEFVEFASQAISSKLGTESTHSSLKMNRLMNRVSSAPTALLTTGDYVGLIHALPLSTKTFAKIIDFARMCLINEADRRRLSLSALLESAARYLSDFTVDSESEQETSHANRQIDESVPPSALVSYLHCIDLGMNIQTTAAGHASTDLHGMNKLLVSSISSLLHILSHAPSLCHLYDSEEHIEQLKMRLENDNSHVRVAVAQLLATVVAARVQILHTWDGDTSLATRYLTDLLQKLGKSQISHNFRHGIISAIGCSIHKISCTSGLYIISEGILQLATRVILAILTTKISRITIGGVSSLRFVEQNRTDQVVSAACIALGHIGALRTLSIPDGICEQLSDDSYEIIEEVLRQGNKKCISD